MKEKAEVEIRRLINHWAAAVLAKKLDGVVANHTDEVVMFDVPPPVVLEGLASYRDSWPQFFDWQRHVDGTFEIARLDVTAGEDVAFATGILRCASRAQLDRDPSPRLRLTLGLRKEDGQWKIAHEHHSFPLEQAG